MKPKRDGWFTSGGWSLWTIATLASAAVASCCNLPPPPAEQDAASSASSRAARSGPKGKGRRSTATGGTWVPGSFGTWTEKDLRSRLGKLGWKVGAEDCSPTPLFCGAVQGTRTARVFLQSDGDPPPLTPGEAGAKDGKHTLLVQVLDPALARKVATGLVSKGTVLAKWTLADLAKQLQAGGHTTDCIEPPTQCGFHAHTYGGLAVLEMESGGAFRTGTLEVEGSKARVDQGDCELTVEVMDTSLSERLRDDLLR